MLETSGVEVIAIKEIASKLNSISWDIISMLSKAEYLSYSDIKKKLNISQNKVTKELARLEGALLIEYRRDEIDARILKFNITNYGTSIIKYRK